MNRECIGVFLRSMAAPCLKRSSITNVAARGSVVEAQQPQTEIRE